MRNLAASLAALPSLLMAATFLITWIAPGALGDDMVRDLVALMMMEFIMVHAGGFLTAFPSFAKTRAGKVRIILGLTALYAVFAIGIPLVCDAPWLIAGFAMLVSGKMAVAWGLPSEKQVLANILAWGANFGCYLAWLGLAFLCPFPRFGIEAQSVKFMGGDKMEDPHCLVGAGFLYFLALAALQFHLQRRAQRPEEPKSTGRRKKRPVAVGS